MYCVNINKCISQCYYILSVCQNLLFLVTCEPLSIENGQVIYNASGVAYEGLDFYYVDTMASFSCNPGYSLCGSDSSICQASGGGTWNHQTPACIQDDMGK